MSAGSGGFLGLSIAGRVSRLPFALHQLVGERELTHLLRAYRSGVNCELELTLASSRIPISHVRGRPGM